MRCRHWLVSNRLQLEEETKRLLLNAVDLWTYGWDWRRFPDCMRRHYEEERDIELEKQRVEKEAAVRMLSGGGGGDLHNQKARSEPARGSKLRGSSSISTLHIEESPIGEDSREESVV